MEFRSVYTLTTAENVPIKVELSGLASRIFAFCLDTLVMLMLMGIFLLTVTLPPQLRQFPEIQKTAVPLGLFLLFFGYHLFQEWLWNGKTLGKSILGIRVVRQDGQAIGFWESLGRNLLRIVDVYILGIGLICMMFQPQEKRFGDLLVGTLVIQDHAIRRPTYQSPVGSAEPENEEPFQAGDVHLSARFLTAEEAELIRAFLARQSQLLRADRIALGTHLCQYLSDRLQQPVQTEVDLQNLLQQYHAHS